MPDTLPQSPPAGRLAQLGARLVLVLLLAGCGMSEPDGPVFEEDTFYVLFIGNSLTYTNNLPGMVEELAPVVQGKPLQAAMIAKPNVSLEDLWNEREAREAIIDGEWDVVVMQQGPSSSPEGRAHLASWVDRFAREARDSGAEPAVLMVWPIEGPDSTFQAVISGYENAADAAGATLYPAGAAWFASISNQDAADPYGPDRFHPSVEGTYLAALVVAARLRGGSALGSPSTLTLWGGEVVEIDAARALVLQRRADEALAAYPG